LRQGTGRGAGAARVHVAHPDALLDRPARLGGRARAHRLARSAPQNDVGATIQAQMVTGLARASNGRYAEAICRWTGCVHAMAGGSARVRGRSRNYRMVRRRALCGRPRCPALAPAGCGCAGHCSLVAGSVHEHPTARARQNQMGAPADGGRLVGEQPAHRDRARRGAVYIVQPSRTGKQQWQAARWRRWHIRGSSRSGLKAEQVATAKGDRSSVAHAQRVPRRLAAENHPFQKFAPRCTLCRALAARQSVAATAGWWRADRGASSKAQSAENRRGKLRSERMAQVTQPQA
jgi:hypothetical protein